MTWQLARPSETVTVPDGQTVPLDYKLQNAQRVEIITVKQGGPSRDWLSPQLGYLASPRAQAKVRAWFRHEDHARDVIDGVRLIAEYRDHGIGHIAASVLPLVLSAADLAVIGRIIDDLLDQMDSVVDLLMAESVFQIAGTSSMDSQ